MADAGSHKWSVTAALELPEKITLKITANERAQFLTTNPQWDLGVLVLVSNQEVTILLQTRPCVYFPGALVTEAQKFYSNYTCLTD